MDKIILVIFEHKIPFFSYFKYKFSITDIYQNSKFHWNKSNSNLKKSGTKSCTNQKLKPIES